MTGVEEPVAAPDGESLGDMSQFKFNRRHRSRPRSVESPRTRSAEQLTGYCYQHGGVADDTFHNQQERFFYSDQNIHNYNQHHCNQPRRRRRHRRNSIQSQSSGSSGRSRISKDSRTSSEDVFKMKNLSFCGCGFLGVYHLGVASCLVKHGPSFLASVDRIAGASAGALVAALLVTSPTPRHVEASTDMVYSFAKSIRRKALGALTPGYRIADDLFKLLDKMLPADAHKMARGKLHVSLTDVKTKQNVVVKDFHSRQELIEVLVASCHIPVYSGAKFPSVRGKQYCDGGLTNNLLRFREGRTVTVSPFSGKQDIGPRDILKKGSKGYFFNLHNQDLQMNFNNVRRFGHAFFPPKTSVLQQYFELGHKDASLFLVREGLYEIVKPDRKPMVYESSV